MDLNIFTMYDNIIMSARQTKTISNSLAWQGEVMNENNLKKIAKEIKRDLHADNKHTSMLFDLCVDGAIMATKDYLNYYKEGNEVEIFKTKLALMIMTFRYGIEERVKEGYKMPKEAEEFFEYFDSWRIIYFTNEKVA